MQMFKLSGRRLKWQCGDKRSGKSWKQWSVKRQSVEIKDLERENRHRVDTDTQTHRHTDTEWQSVEIKDLGRANRHRAPMSFSAAQRYKINLTYAKCLII